MFFRGATIQRSMKNINRFTIQIIIKKLRRLCWGATYATRPTIATQYGKGICSVLSKWSIFLFMFTCVLTIAELFEGVCKKPNVAHIAQCLYLQFYNIVNAGYVLLLKKYLFTSKVILI